MLRLPLVWMFFDPWSSVASALSHCRHFPACDFIKMVRSVLFITPLFLQSTPIKYVINVVVRITPWRSESLQNVLKRLLAAGEQTVTINDIVQS